MGTLESEPIRTDLVVLVLVPKFWESVKSVSVPILKIRKPVWLIPVSIPNFRGGYPEPLTPRYGDVGV